MGLGISPFLCDYYLLYWEIKQCERICNNIHQNQLESLSYLPPLLATIRYLDDILFIFPLDAPGSDTLKVTNGGPYPQTLGINLESSGKRINYLDLTIFQRRPRKNKALSTKEPTVLSQIIHEKKDNPKYEKLHFRRGIDHSTALSLNHQTLSILSEGVRMSRKCQRLKSFLSHFGRYLIEYVTQPKLYEPYIIWAVQ